MFQNFIPAKDRSGNPVLINKDWIIAIQPNGDGKMRVIYGIGEESYLGYIVIPAMIAEISTYLNYSG